MIKEYKTTHKIPLDNDRTLTIYHKTTIEGPEHLLKGAEELHQANTKNVKQFFTGDNKNERYKRL